MGPEAGALDLEDDPDASGDSEKSHSSEDEGEEEDEEEGARVQGRACGGAAQRLRLRRLACGGAARRWRAWDGDPAIDKATFRKMQFESSHVVGGFANVAAGHAADGARLAGSKPCRCDRCSRPMPKGCQRSPQYSFFKIPVFVLDSAVPCHGLNRAADVCDLPRGSTCHEEAWGTAAGAAPAHDAQPGNATAKGRSKSAGVGVGGRDTASPDP